MPAGAFNAGSGPFAIPASPGYLTHPLVARAGP